ncbi:hypothetical protein CMV_019671 [Castanea mollissima]|uniref:Uncharacterized protein n=1 Tax=Castanea mollissima TaxID=60419 RepID=A0A8J4QXS4_9ROSI|nr:hypothetical protein CMV_019671 [Castanea mollissima]
MISNEGHSMAISSQIHSMKMFSTLFVVILMPDVLMTLSLPIMLDFQERDGKSIDQLKSISLCKFDSPNPVEYTILVLPEELSIQDRVLQLE